MDVQGRKITVVGLAKSGLAIIELLHRKGAVVTASDARPLDELPGVAEFLDALGIRFVTQGPQALEDCDLAVLSPGVRPDQDLFIEARRLGVSITGDVELALRWLRGPVVGITGSNGKTTTTALCGHLLRECGIPVQVGGNIGTAVAALVETSSDSQWNILELSSFQTEMFEKARIHVAVALNVTPDHLDRHGSLENYADAKARLFLNQQPGDFAILNHDDAITRAYAGKTPASIRWFSTAGAVDCGFWLNNGELMAGHHAWMPASEVPLRGRHNIENVLAAGCAAHIAGGSLDALRKAVATFPGVEHRIEFVRTLDGVAWYNDSKATNVDATVKALESFDGNLWVILGGKDKGSDYTTLRPLLLERADGVLLIGAAAEKIAGHLAAAGGLGNIPVVHCGDIQQAVRHAHTHAHAGDTVLLAPACASFDQFQGYEHRGRVFKDFVHRLEAR